MLRNATRAYDMTRFAAGFVFLSAAVFRVFNPAAAAHEMIRLHLPAGVSWAIVVFEIAVAMMFLLNVRVRLAALATILFLCGAIALALAIYWKEVFAAMHELFVFNPTPTDILLHVMYVLFLVLLVRGLRDTGDRTR